MTISEAQQRAAKKYQSEHYGQIRLALPKAEIEAIKGFAKDHGESTNGFIRRVVKEAMGYEDPEPSED